MKTVDVISELYIPVLKSLDISPDENGELNITNNGDTLKCEISKKRLVLPTQDKIRSHDPNKEVFFHPLSENVARGDSSIQNYLRNLVTHRLNLKAIVLFQALLELAVRQELHAEMKSGMLQLLEALPSVDEKTWANSQPVFKHIDSDRNKIITVFSKRNGKIDGVTYKRVATVDFPVIKALFEETPESPWDAKLRKADIKAYRALMDFMLPGWSTPHHYSGASDKMEAPSFQALMLAYAKVSQRFNELEETFRPLFNKLPIGRYTKQIPVDLGYLDALNNLTRYLNIIPPQEGNIGAVNGAVATGDVPATPPSVPPQPVIPSIPLNQNAGQARGYNEQVPAAQPEQAVVQPPTQQQYQQPIQQPMAPQQYPQQPQYQQPMQQQGGFIGYPVQQPQPYGYQQPMPPQQQYQQPMQQQEQPRRFISYPPQRTYAGLQPMMSPQQVAQLDPIAQWNMNTAMVPQQPAVPYGYQPPAANFGYPQQQMYQPQQTFKVKR